MTVETERLALYERMLLVRAFESALSRLVAEAKVHGFVHLALGQEAVEVGACAALRSDDQIVGTHRCHGQLLAKGADPRRLMAEIIGRETGYSRGRGGEMHMAIPEIGVVATTGIVGGGLPIAVGAGLAARNLGAGRVVLCFFGDGAVAQGTFHESLNIAALWRLPVIFLCVVNRFAEMSAIELHLAQLGIANRAAGYGCRGVVIDGNDVEAVRSATAEAAGDARAGRGPVLLEAQTFLLTGHYEGADQSYRDPEAVAAAQALEPLQAFKTVLRADGVSSDVLASIEGAVQERVAQAVAEAIADPVPTHADLASEAYTS